MPVKIATREVIAPKLRPNLLLVTEARMGVGPARSLLPQKGEQEEQEEVKKQSQVGLVAWALGPHPLASTIEAALPGLPCNKTRPHSSDLRGRAALPAGRTARRPAPAQSSPWRRGLARGRERCPVTERLFADRGAPVIGAGAGTLERHRRSSKVYFRRLRKESGPSRFWPAAMPRPPRRSPRSQPAGPPHLAASRIPRPAHWPYCAGAARPTGISLGWGCEGPTHWSTWKWAGAGLLGAGVHVIAKAPRDWAIERRITPEQWISPLFGWRW